MTTSTPAGSDINTATAGKPTAESDRMRVSVLVVTASYEPAYVYGGPIRSVAALCRTLRESGLHVDVISSTANGTHELMVTPGRLYSVNGVPVRYYRRWTGDHSQFSPGLLWFLLLECRKYDVVHIQSWWNLVAVGAAVVCWLRGVRPMISLRGTLSSHSLHHRNQITKAIFHRVCGKFLLRRSLLHVTSTKEEREVRALVSGCKVEVLPNLFSISQPVHVHDRSGNGSLRLIYVGRIDPIKNLDLLFTALQDSRLAPEWTLDIIGRGATEYEMKLKQSGGNDPRIRWLGNLDGHEKLSRIARADLLVLLSHSENFGNVVIEALSQGTAVLVSEHVGVASYVTQKDLGWVIRPDVTTCVDKLNAIGKSPLYLNRIRGIAPEIIRKDFSMDTLGAAYLDLYHTTPGHRKSLSGKVAIHTS